MSRRDRNRLVAALLIAPILIGFPMVRDLVQNPRLSSGNWDVILLFLVLPYAAAAILLLAPRSRRGRTHDPAGDDGQRFSRFRGRP